MIINESIQEGEEVISIRIEKEEENKATIKKLRKKGLCDGEIIDYLYNENIDRSIEVLK